MSTLPRYVPGATTRLLHSTRVLARQSLLTPVNFADTVIPGDFMSITFGAEANVYTGGGRGAVAVDSSGTVVVVMLTSAGLVYSIGSVDASTSTVSFPNSPNTAYAWGDDEMPAINFGVAIQYTGNTVVLVWQTGGGENALYYRTGSLNDGWIVWNPIHNFDSGMYPSVTIAGTSVIELHVSQNDAQKTYYHLGTLDGQAIDGFADQDGTEFAKYWQPIAATSCVLTTNSWFLATIAGGQPYGLMVNSYSAGLPSLKVVGNEPVGSAGTTSVVLLHWGGTLLEVHDLNPTDIHFGTIYMTQGTLDENTGDTYGQLTWQAPTSTGVKGMYPNIAASGDGVTNSSYVVMTYMSSDDTGSTKARCVTVS
jgi:hypothetical protein